MPANFTVQGSEIAVETKKLTNMKTERQCQKEFFCEINSD